MSGPNEASDTDLVVPLPPEILAMMAAYEAAPDAEADDETASAMAAEPDIAEAGEEVVFAAPLTLPDLPDEDGATEALVDEAAISPLAGPAAAGAETGDEVAETMVLTAVLDLTAASALHAALLARRGSALSLDAGSVRRLGGQCLQLLVSAAKTWDADGVPIGLGATSDAFERDLALLGMKPSDLFQNEAA
ncbi:STAS domain-containing protein [Aureimonas sp. AU12]|uniref:STAS domain-containing protein n=1 Tax=Aureimonas sp. AU12 TaxID=1638161 RepID=UPI000B02FB80|nr:STAS domain-containing protein [Aureimonas sp. AU12]